MIAMRSATKCFWQFGCSLLLVLFCLPGPQASPPRTAFVAKQALNVFQRALEEPPPPVNVSASIVTGADGTSTRSHGRKSQCFDARRPLVNAISPSVAGPFEAGVAGAFFIALVYEDDAFPPFKFHDPLLSVTCVSLDVSDAVSRQVDFCNRGPRVSLVGQGEYIVEFSVGTIW
jgi:hypothetical protein